MFARGLESIGGSYYLLDETALGRQEEWEEPKGRADSARSATPELRELTFGRCQAALNRPSSGPSHRVPHQNEDRGDTAMTTGQRTYQAPIEIAPDTYLIHDHNGEGAAP